MHSMKHKNIYFIFGLMFVSACIGIFVLYMYYKYYINRRITITSMTKGLNVTDMGYLLPDSETDGPHNGPDGSMPGAGQKKTPRNDKHDGKVFYNIPDDTNIKNITAFSYGGTESTPDFIFDSYISKSWPEGNSIYRVGAEYDCGIINNTKYRFENWVLTIQLPKISKLDSYWNGVYSLDKKSLVTITPLEYNSTVEPGKDVTFGFVLHMPADFTISDFSVTYDRKGLMTDNPLFFALLAVIFIDIIICITTIFNDMRYNRLKKRQLEIKKIIEQSFKTFSRIIDAKDQYTRGHSIRVAVYSRELAKRLNMNADEQENIYYIGLLHDIGKIGIPDEILNKKGKLDDNEMAEIRKHVDLGGKILEDFNALRGISEGAKYHHERYDGTGYSSGLAGENIPLCARIICVADSFDAMSSARCYRGAMPIEYIKEEFQKCSGKQFDPKIVPIILDMIDSGMIPVKTE
jgi:putative nucleotidyltransferase with HDIG domain